MNEEAARKEKESCDKSQESDTFSVEGFILHCVNVKYGQKPVFIRLICLFIFEVMQSEEIHRYSPRERNKTLSGLCGEGFPEKVS